MSGSILGEHDTEIRTDTLDQYRGLVFSMLSQARHQLDIFTPDLEPQVLDSREIEGAVLRLAKAHPDTRIRILVKDSMRSVQNGHRLIRLAQQLTSSVFINKPSSKHMDQLSAFIIVDKVGMIFRPAASERNYTATVNFKTPRAAAKQQEHFDELWEHSSTDIQTRRLYV